jgi:hypothetical protein
MMTLFPRYPGSIKYFPRIRKRRIIRRRRIVGIIGMIRMIMISGILE